MKTFLKNSLPIILAIILIGGSFVLGFSFGKNQKTDIEKITTLKNKEGNIINPIDFAPFWTAWNILNEKYVSPNGEITDQEKVWGAIKGLANSVDDPYTIFLPPSDAEIFNADIKGNFGGVGMEIGIRDHILTVIAPLKDTPAEKAGIRAGDKIVKIEDQLTTDFTTTEAVKLIRGKIGTPVNLTVSREEVVELIPITIIRGNIQIPTIKTEIKDDVFVISLYSFSAISPGLFRDALREFVESNNNKLILDLRGNPGGYMEAAIDMASWFLPAGKVVVSENFGKNADGRSHRSRGYNVFNDNLKLVILIDAGSASASEILAGALSEHKIATLVGSKTYGKGSVQELINITDDTSLKVTVARWLTPEGNSISKDGLTPTVEIKLDVDKFENGSDSQLEKAIEVVKGL